MAIKIGEQVTLFVSILCIFLNLFLSNTSFSQELELVNSSNFSKEIVEIDELGISKDLRICIEDTSLVSKTIAFAECYILFYAKNYKNISKRFDLLFEFFSIPPPAPQTI